MKQKNSKGFNEFLIKFGVFWILFILIQVATMWLVAESKLPPELKPFSMSDLAKAFLFVIVLLIGFTKEKILKIKSYSVKIRTRIISFLGIIIGFLIYFPYKNYVLNNLDSAIISPYRFIFLEYFILLVILCSLIIFVFGIKFPRDFIKNFKKDLVYLIFGTFLIYLLIRKFQGVWFYFSGIVGKSVVYLLGFMGPSNIYYFEKLPVVSFRDFIVGIAQTCSGIDSMLLFTFLFFGILAWDWKILNKKKAVFLFCIGIIGVFLLNILRIFFLILIGAYLSQSFALNIFHTNASSIFFIIYFGIFWKLSYKWLKNK
jgi:exosortase/archaeosortase family protein